MSVGLKRPTSHQAGGIGLLHPAPIIKSYHRLLDSLAGSPIILWALLLHVNLDTRIDITPSFSGLNLLLRPSLVRDLGVAILVCPHCGTVVVGNCAVYKPAGDIEGPTPLDYTPFDNGAHQVMHG